MADSVADSIWKVFEKFIYALHLGTTKTGGVPQLSFIESKPEPLGTGYNNLAYRKTGIIFNT